MNHQERIYKLIFAKVYPLYVQKAEKKGRTQAEADEIIFWLTGYTPESLQQQIDNQSNFETFFAQAPQIHPNASKITGLICGYRVEEIEDKVVQQTRYLDKLIGQRPRPRRPELVTNRRRYPLESLQ